MEDVYKRQVYAGMALETPVLLGYVCVLDI